LELRRRLDLEPTLILFDNFGAGYASLISRADLPITKLVIDCAHSTIEDP
jgi:predicted signal transduction protein with EAL and GGDEF domain